MATEPHAPDALERLNALIDGELPPAEHAALAGRIAAGRDLAQAHATLAKLKACLVASAEETPVTGIVLPQTPPRRRAFGVTGGALAAAAVALLAIFAWTPGQQPVETPLAKIAPMVTLAALPQTPVIPDLTRAGLKLVGGEVERAGDVAVLVAAYRGPRGCRLELRVRSVASDVAPTVGTSRTTWTADDLSYELVAFGMPAGRFDAVAAAAKAATGGNRPETETRLREASLQAPPCTG